MKKELWVCDKCGKELTKDDYIDFAIDCADIQDSYDLCEDCYDGLTKLVSNYLRSNNDK